MTYMARIKATVLDALETVNEAEYIALRIAGANNSRYWDSQPPEEAEIFARFKREVKSYYRGAQGLKCCYCSFELRDDHSTFDAEHILDKSTHNNFMFDLNNLAVACKCCNRAKNTKNPLVDNNANLAAVPSEPNAYRILHPHLDEWSLHLEFDEVNRIRPVRGSQKGAATIDVCDIHVLNAARLASHFRRHSRSAEMMLRSFFRYKRRSKKIECLNLLRALADEHNLAPAQAIVGRLENEFERGEA